MKCQSCHERQATVVVTTVVDDEKSVQHLCAVCAKEHGLDAGQVSNEEGAAAMEQHPDTSGKSEGNEELHCPNCGLSYSRFKERYRLGCAVCYEAFRDRLVPLLRKVQGAEQHVGKRFVRTAEAGSAKKQPVAGTWTLEILKRRLNAAIEREEFEEAARLRDQIEATKQAQSKESGTS